MLAAATVEHASHCVLRLAARLTHREGAVESTVRLLGRLPAGFTDAAGDVPGPSAAADGRGGRRGEGGLPVLSPKAAAALGAEMAAMLLAGGGAGLATRGTWLGLVRFAAAVSASADERGARAGSEALSSLCSHSAHACPLHESLPELWPLLLLHARACRTPAHCERAVGLMADVHARLREETAGGGGEAPSEEWRADWLLVLRGFCSLCLDTRLPCRDAPLLALQRAVLAGDPPALPPAVWAEAFEQAVFPLLTELLRQWVAATDAAEQERLMLRGVTLLSKAFLHHLSGLLSLRSFHLLWLRALELLEQFLRAPQSELLAEAVPETLKNMLLVMGASGAFESRARVGDTPQTLAQLTAAVVETMCPQLSGSPDLAGLWHEAQPAAAPAVAAA